MNETKFDLKEFLPRQIYSGKNENKYNLDVKESGDDLILSYSVPLHNWKGLTGNGKREYSDFIRKYINRNFETFEVLGLLQAEMGKTQNGCLNFSNNEFKIIKKVMTWFEKELHITCNDWRWYIKVNINEPEDLEYKKQIESKVTKYWLDKTKINFSMKYPKTVSYIKNTKNKKLKFYDYGSLIIEYKRNIFSQVIKRFVNEITYKHILSFEKDEVKGYMKGIIAGESCVEINIPYKKFRIHITANKKEERDIFEKCLDRLDISSSNYINNKDLLISKKHNLLQLLQQKLMCLNPKKYNKFLRIFELYVQFPEYNYWKKQQTGPHNKTSQEVINKIIKLHQQNPSLSCIQIANKVGVSKITVNRVLRKNNLGKRLVKTPEALRREIAKFATQNNNLKQYEIAKHFNVHDSVVRRVIRKYKNNNIYK